MHEPTLFPEDEESASHAISSGFNTTALNLLDVRDSAKTHLLNSTYISLVPHDLGTAYIEWTLDAHVEDSRSLDIPDATINAYFANDTFAATGQTDAYGRTRFALAEKMINVTGEYGYGNYTVEASCAGKTDNVTIQVDDNKQVYLQLDVVIPEYGSTLLIITLFAATTLAIATPVTARGIRKKQIKAH